MSVRDDEFRDPNPGRGHASEPLRNVPDGSIELVMAAEGLILADRLETLLTIGRKIGVDAEVPMFVITASGRVNQTDELRTVNVSMTPKGALDFAYSVFETLEAGYGLLGVRREVDPRG